MPIVRVNMFEGRSIEKKRELVEGITEVVARVCEVSPDGVHVLIEEVTRDNWGRGGIVASDRQTASV
jgi:4-oxalocrotonate tautomerase